MGLSPCFFCDFSIVSNVLNNIHECMNQIMCLLTYKKNMCLGTIFATVGQLTAEVYPLSIFANILFFLFFFRSY